MDRSFLDRFEAPMPLAGFWSLYLMRDRLVLGLSVTAQPTLVVSADDGCRDGSLLKVGGFLIVRRSRAWQVTTGRSTVYEGLYKMVNEA